MRILVVDDEEVIREFLGELLASLGHDVSSAADGREGLASIEADPPDLVISDIRMPVMDGLQLLQKVSEMPEGPELILLTGFGELETAIQAVKLGAYDYLTKPVNGAEIANRLTRFERQRELTRQLEKEREERTRAETVRQMIVTLSHELNNPMTSIWGNVTYLGRCHRLGEVPEEYDEILASLERNCRRMGDLLTRLRHVQRVETTEYLPGTPMVDIQGEETRGAGDADGDES